MPKRFIGFSKGLVSSGGKELITTELLLATVFTLTDLSLLNKVIFLWSEVTDEMLLENELGLAILKIVPSTSCHAHSYRLIDLGVV